MRQFAPPHLAALAVLVLAAPAAVLIARRGSERVTQIVYRILAVLILSAWIGEYVADVIQGIWTVQYDLPLQLTDVISFTTAIALWTRSQRATEFVYLWALSASLQATVTPDLSWDYPSVFYFTYFTYHVVAVVAGVGLVFGCGLYPKPGAALRVFVGTLAWAAVAGAGDPGAAGGGAPQLTQPTLGGKPSAGPSAESVSPAPAGTKKPKKQAAGPGAAK